MAKTEKKTVRFVDTTLRDAHQSLWATRMRTKDILGILEAVDDAGFIRKKTMHTLLRSYQNTGLCPIPRQRAFRSVREL